jgi:hypothetical protein
MSLQQQKPKTARARKCVLHVAGRTEASHARQKIPQPGNRASNLKLPLCDRLPIWSLNQGPLSITALSLDPFPLPMRHGSFETAENVSRHFYSLSHGIIGLPTVPSCSQGRCLYHWPRPLLGRPKPADVSTVVPAISTGELSFSRSRLSITDS